MPSRSDEPPRAEVESQLEWILTNEPFATALMLSKLLGRLVRDNLDKKPIDEYNLGIELFGKPQSWEPMFEAVVRQNMVNLRKNLAAYYETAGRDDAVRIEFPKGRGFKARFCYNPRGALVAQYQQAMALFDQTFPEVLPKTAKTVTESLMGCITAQPDYGPAYASLAEILLKYALCGDPYYFEPRRCVREAERVTIEGASCNADNWLAHALAGALLCCRFEWQIAEKEFNWALDLAPDKTRSHFFYIAFLVATGKGDEALECVKTRIDNTPSDRFAWMIYVLCLYVRREFKEAYQVIKDQLANPRVIRHWLDYHTETEICVNWLVELLMACICLELNYIHVAWKYADAASKHSVISAYQGVMVLALARYGVGDPEFLHRAKEMLQHLRREPNAHGSISLVLAYMALGEPKSAIEQLRIARDNRNPILVWLHLWPIFDPLRGDQEFKALVEGMKVPR